MRYLTPVFIVCALFLFASSGYASETSEQKDLTSFVCGGSQDAETPVLDELFLAGRGCCSGHGGACGCIAGRVSCCDGTLSPSCSCMKDDRIGNEKNS